MVKIYNFKEKKVIFFLSCIVFFEILLFIFNSKFSEPTNLESVNIASIKEKWKKEIEKMGGERAYQEFERSYSRFSIDDQHAMAHLFGEVLYKKVGQVGIRVCDASMGYGCYHGFFKEAIEVKGKPIVKDLASACYSADEDASGCLHGVGHAILPLVGYDNFNQALTICKQISNGIILQSCASGVFMEYNFKTMADVDKKSTLNSWNPDKPYEPCNKISDEFLSRCYYEQVDWWYTAFDGDTEKIESLCGATGTKEGDKACFTGIGLSIIHRYDYNLQRAQKICDNLKSKQSTISCNEGVKMRVNFIENDRSTIHK